MLQNNPSFRPPDDLQASEEEAGNSTGQQTPIVGLPATPRRTCSIHKGGYCCLASPQFQDFIAGYALGSSFMGDSEQQNSSSSSVEPASTILTTSASASGSTLDVLTTAAAPGANGPSVSPTVSAVPLVAESVSSSSSEGTMKTNLVTSDISARTRGKPASIMVKRMPADSSSPSLPPGLPPPSNHSAPSLPLTPTSVLSYASTPASTLAFASRSLHDLPSSSSIAAATAFANLTPKARRRTLDSFALADENAARRDWKVINPPYKPETLPSRSGGSAGNLRRATISGSGGMSHYGMGRDASAARWSKLMEAARSEDDARAGLNRALNNEGTKPKPTRRKTVQIYEPIKSSPLVPKPSPPPSPPLKEEMMTTSTDTLSLPASSVSPMSLSASPTPSLSTVTTQSQIVPSVVVSSAETDSTSTTQQRSSSPPASVPASVPVPVVHRTIPPSPSEPPPEPPKEVTLAVKLFGPPPPTPVPVSALRAQTPQGQVQATSPASVPPPSSPLAAPPIQAPSPSPQAVPTAPTAPTTIAVIPTPAITPQTTTAVATITPSPPPPPTVPIVTLPTPTNHVHLSRRTYIPPYKHTSFLSRLFSPFSHSHGSHGNISSSSTASHSSSVLQPPTFTSTKHPPPSSSSHGASSGGGLGRDITGTFVIDPLLVLPKGLFRAFSDDTFVGLSSTPTPSSEFISRGGGGDVGNRGSGGVGGIEGELRNVSDADDVGVGGGLRLKRSRSFDGSTPTPSRGAFSRYHHGRVNGLSIAEAVEGGRNGVGGRGGGQGEKEKEKKNLKLEVENGGMDVDVHVIPTPIVANINGRRTRVQGPESGSQKKRTTIELNLLSPTINSFERGRGRGGKSGQQQVPEFPLIARIHAKSPRQPLHITARTYTPPPRPSSPTNEPTPAVLAMPAIPSQPPSTKLVASQLSPPPPPPPPPLPPPPPPTHPRTSPLPFSTSPTPTPPAVDRPPSPTSSIHTAHTSRTTQTTYTARTTITNITTPTATSPTETGAGTGKGTTGPKRSASTGRKLKKKRLSQQQQKRMPTLTPYYYASADEAVAAGGTGVVGGGVEDTREGVNVGTDIRGVGGEGEDGGGGGVQEETSAPPYTRTHEPHEPSETPTDHRRPPDPYDLVNPIKPTQTPNATYANNPPPALPVPPVPAPMSAPPPSTSHNDPIDSKYLQKSNSKKQQQQPRLIMDSSNLTLSIPRTFHGPLSIHVQAGNLDEHIELSGALQRECVLVKEGRSARGLFVGDFRKEFGFDWGGGVSVEGTEGVENVEGKGESEGEVVECICGTGVEVVVGEIREVEVEKKAKVQVRGEEEKKVKRKPVVGFSTTMTNGNPDLHPGSEESSSVSSTPQMTTLHTRAKSNPPFGTSSFTPTPPTHARSQSIPSGLPFPTSSRDPSSQQQLQPHRPSFLDVDPESLMHRTNSGGSNGLGQIGWKMTKVQNVNGRVRVVSEHQPIMKSPLRNGGALAPLAPVPPVPPLPKGQGQTQTPAWVVPKSGLPGNGHGAGSVKERQRSVTPEDGDGEVHVRRLSIERKVFNPVRGWEDSGSPTRAYVNANGEVGGGDAEDSSSSGGGGGGGSVEEVKRRRRASAPATSTMMTDGGGKRRCTCGARTRTHSAVVGGKTRNSSIDTRRGEGTEWMGDRIDISIGGGKVKLLYDDESVDAFVPIGGAGVVDVVKKEKKRWWKFGKGG